MVDVLDIFKEIAKKVPRCSGNTSSMRDFIINESKLSGFQVKTDSVGNILVSKGVPKICLQAHYDMVCIGECSSIEVLDDGSFLKAKNSTLGADNGIGIAMMLILMQDENNLECLFTNDEEIGLIGARGIELEPLSPYILNLDAEEEGFVYIGCAGGFEISAKKIILDEAYINTNHTTLEHRVENLPGGHSGIDIDKNIPNAIIEVLKYVKSENGLLLGFEGGEKLNSIPKSAKCSYTQHTSSCKLVDFLLSLPDGVQEKNHDLGIVELSINFAKLFINSSEIQIQMYARAMSDDKMKIFEDKLIEVFKKENFCVATSGHYSPWKPEANEFAQFVRTIMKKQFFTSGFKAIHAGLECGVLKERMPNKLFASIGPNIHNPHTIDERVEIESVRKCFETLKEILREIEKI